MRRVIMPNTPTSRPARQLYGSTAAYYLASQSFEPTAWSAVPASEASLTLACAVERVETRQEAVIALKLGGEWAGTNVRDEQELADAQSDLFAADAALSVAQYADQFDASAR